MAVPTSVTPGVHRMAFGALVGGLGVVVATHAGYPAAVRLAARASRHATAGADPGLPSISIVIPAFDEAEFIAEKLLDTWRQQYPSDLLELLVVDDGSVDATADLAERSPVPCRVVRQWPRAGKAAAMNRGVAQATGDVVVFTDANGSLAPNSLTAIVRPFADPRVMVVGGTKRPIGEGAHGAGEGMYWRLEHALQTAESVFGAVAGVDGGVYAVRRAGYRPIPAGVYADDYWIPLDALARGWRVAHIGDAGVLESVSGSSSDDFERRTRIAAGIWRESLRHLQLADPRRGWVAASFVFHRLLRTIVVPWLLPVLLVAALVASPGSRVARALAWTQALAWGSAGVGAVTGHQSLAVPFAFAYTNLAALRGGVRHLQSGQSALWLRTERGPWQ